MAAETGLSLADAITLASQHSFAIRAAGHDSAAAALAYSAARADRFPVLTLSARSFLIDEVQAIDLPFADLEIGSKDNHQADFTLSVPLYTGGRLSSRIGAERENGRAASLALEAEKLAVAYHCRRAYLNLMAARASANAAASSLERLTIIRRDVASLYDNGMADSIDVLEAELALQKGRQSLERLQAVRENASATLARLVGGNENTVIEPTESIPPPAHPGDSGLPPGGDIERPELIRLDHKAEAARRAVGIEYGALLPTLNGFVGYSYGKPNRDWFDKSWNDYFSVGFVLNWQVNLAGQGIAEVQAARQRAASARMLRRDLHDSFLLQRDRSLTNLRHAYRMFRITEEEYGIAERQYRLARVRREEGQMSVNRLLEMEAELAATEQQYRVSVVNYYLAQTEYLYAIGSHELFGGLR